MHSSKLWYVGTTVSCPLDFAHIFPVRSSGFTWNCNVRTVLRLRWFWLYCHRNTLFKKFTAFQRTGTDTPCLYRLSINSPHRSHSAGLHRPVKEPNQACQYLTTGPRFWRDLLIKLTRPLHRAVNRGRWRAETVDKRRQADWRYYSVELRVSHFECISFHRQRGSKYDPVSLSIIASRHNCL